MPSTLSVRPGRRRELVVAILDDGRQQQQVAVAAGISPMTLSGIVTGRIREPRRGTRERIARALNRPHDELFPEYADDPIDDADESAGFDESVAAKVRAQCAEQGVAYELTDEQLDFIGAVIASDQRRASTH